MATLTRRQFLAWSAQLAAVMGLEATAVPHIAEALENFASGQLRILWLQGLSCSGCSVSFLNSEAPDPAEVLTQYLTLGFHSTLSAATGELAAEVVNRTIEKGGFYLVVEGSMPVGMPKACMFAGEPVTEQVLRASRMTQAVICVGTCASFGGIPGAEGNPTGAVSVSTFLTNQKISTPVINIPGCPAHPDWLVGTLVHLFKFGIPVVDELKRPVMFYHRFVHDQCPRFSDYERERFAKTFTDDGCLFKLGCLGPVTHADCTLRFWNGRTNYCIKAGAPCIGCASETFALRKHIPFYTPQTTS